jgi:hypothetical protein
MNYTKVVLAAALFLGAAGITYAQEPEPKPPKQDEPRGDRDVAPPPQQEEPKPQQPEKQENPKPPKEGQPAHEAKGQAGEPAHARPAGKSARIPDPKFKANFGRQHTFTVTKVVTTTTVVPNQTQFVYGGYTFIFLDPWPPVWLLTDDCYIDYVDGDYFLFDAFHPGIRVALFVAG